MDTIKVILLQIRDKFSAAGLETPELDARLLVQEVLGITYEDIFLNNNRILSEFETKTLNEMVARRLAREPVSRILGKRSFWKSEFKISKETLDPRADSETLVEAVLKYTVAPAKAGPPRGTHALHAEHAAASIDSALAGALDPGFRRDDKSAAILDLGTGSGCLLLSLLQEFPQAMGTGVDISEDAIKTAKQNAADLDLSPRSIFMSINWKDFKPEKLFDVVISNPPYIVENEIASLAPEVREYDPFQALSGGPDGLDCYRAIAGHLKEWLAPEGLLFLEIGATQAEAVKGILAGSGLRVLEVAPDLAGHNRCIVARWV